MSKHLFSIVVPIYKAEKYIEECIESVLNQTHDDFELILVDDGSPDKCPQICDYYSQKDLRIKVIHKRNGGSVSARKEGVENSNGKYIVFLDSDDWFEPNLLKDLKAIIDEHHPSTIVYGYKLLSNNQLTVYYQNSPSGMYINNKEKLYKTMISKKPFFSFGLYPTLWTTCSKKELILEAQKNVPNDITIGDDASIVYPCLLLSESIYVSNITGCIYRDNNQSMTHKFDRNMDKRINILSNYIVSVLKSLNLKNISQVYDYIAFLTIQVAGNYLINRDADYSKNEAYKKVANFLKLSVIDEALNSCDIINSLTSLSTKIKVFLLRRKRLDLYSLFAKVIRLLKCGRS